MKKLKVRPFNLLIVLLFFHIILFQTLYGQIQEESKIRLIILADMGNEPDEEQQMVHMLVCSNEFELKGLIAVTGKYLRSGPREDLFFNLIDGYEKVLPNLKLHAKGWPEPDYLRSITCSGQENYGIEDVGEGKTSPGSELIAKTIREESTSLLWIVINAGSNTLAQALYDLRKETDSLELNRLIRNIRVYENGAQDNAGAWICHNFSEIHWIRSNNQTYAYGGPEQLLGPSFWGDYEYSAKGQHDWLKEHVMENHGVLGQLYPNRYIEEHGRFYTMEGGGTIPWIGLVNKGLFDLNNPHWGGWGGRFSKEKQLNHWSKHIDIKKEEEGFSPFYAFVQASDTWIDSRTNIKYHNVFVPVWRWREAMYNDFICRMDWCVSPYNEANHSPVAIVNSQKQHTLIKINARPGQEVILDGSESYDPDGDSLIYNWWYYPEPGSYPGDVLINNASGQSAGIIVPYGAMGKEIHIIFEVKDDNPIASLFDYARVIIYVSDN